MISHFYIPYSHKKGLNKGRVQNTDIRSDGYTGMTNGGRIGGRTNGQTVGMTDRQINNNTIRHWVHTEIYSHGNK